MKILVFIITDNKTKKELLRMEKKLQDPQFARQLLRLTRKVKKSAY